jgi:hypothetical protein
MDQGQGKGKCARSTDRHAAATNATTTVATATF